MMYSVVVDSANINIYIIYFVLRERPSNETDAKTWVVS